MSNKTFNAKNNRAKKAISPVIATVILVAVAVVIAAALAGFSGSLFGSYSQGAQVRLQSLSMTPAGDINLLMSNAGSAADQIVSFTTSGQPDHLTATDTGVVNTVAANSASTAFGPFATGWAFNAGQQVTLVVHMQSGQTITQTVTVTP